MKYLSLLLCAFLLIPNLVAADIETPGEESPPTFEKAATLTLSIAGNSEEVVDGTVSNLTPGVSYAFTYRVGYKSEAYQDDLFGEYRSFLSLWRGQPLMPSAERLESWDITGETEGQVIAAVPDAEEYFFLVDVPNYLYRDPDEECARVGDPPEVCAPEATLPVDDPWAYVTSARAQADDRNGGVYTSMGFGGVRFSVAPVPAPRGISNVLFLPGLQGSRLYERVLGVENRRWELSVGMSQRDAQALYLDPSGESVNSIYTKDVIGKTAIGIPGMDFDLYRSFFAKLDSLLETGELHEYVPFAYDWRASPIDVVEKGTPYEDEARFPSEVLERLANTSPTGKVTIVAHSNGGLVAKALMQRLEREGKTHLVDTIVFADVPQLGTPQAIAPMLHGDYGALTSFGGLYLTKSNARKLAEHMPDGFALLPSAAYFAKVLDPVVDLSAAPQLMRAAGLVSPEVDSHESFKTFVTGTRSKPSATDIETPNVLSSELFVGGQSLHESLDAWDPPPGVQLIEVAGWGLDTVRGIGYVEQQTKECTLLTFGCREVTKTTHYPLLTTAGDGTVVGASEVTGKGETYVIDLPRANRELGKNWRHADITETRPFQELFDHLFKEAPLPAYVNREVPEDSRARLRLRALSPVALHAYDEAGRHTGTLPGENPEVLMKEEAIPNSYYEEFGEGKYLGVPLSGDLRIAVTGEGSGTFTLEAEVVEEGTVTQTLAFKDVPVTPATKVELDVNEHNLPASTLIVNGKAVAGEETAVGYLELIRSSLPSLVRASSTALQLNAKLTNVGNILLKKPTWEAADDDLDRYDVKKGEKLNVRAERKVTKVETWVERQLARKPAKKGLPLLPQEAETLLRMLAHIKALID